MVPELAPERVRPPKLEIRPPKVLEFRLWRGLLAAEGAAESVLSSFLLHTLHEVSSELRGCLGSVIEVFRSLFGPSFEFICTYTDQRNQRE